ncbi:MAG TPA: glutamine--fructose-6-phosphate transaminase (isomerizing) [Nitrososphaerales archaeon]|nr:glutamine--fructose-6-phosphate transaminase (isomerizing) [Nitrososphaerales archaeon]
MCGIIAAVSSEDEVAPMLVEGLKREEYRGYDSAGVAVLNGKGTIAVRKDVGRVRELEQRYSVARLGGKVGIAHTRWATHGGVSQRNAHPQLSCGGEVAIVHNGIIENYLELKKGLESRGHRFTSETDSEVIAHLIEEEYERGRDPVKATLAAAKLMRGQYAFVVLFRDRPDLLVGARYDAPLVVGMGERTKFLASDVLAFLEHTDRAVFLDNKEVVELTAKGLRVFNLRGKEVAAKNRTETKLAWELGSLSKANYAHYTLKEIHEQPSTVQSALSQDAEKVDAIAERLKGARSVVFTAAGSSYHAALLMRIRLAVEARMRCEVVLSGEFERELPFVDDQTVVVALSQSGETADVLEAVKMARRKKVGGVVSLVNAGGSSLARQSDQTLLLNCGPEVGVAATKSFTAQVMLGNLVIDRMTGRDTIGDPVRLGALVEKALETEPLMKRLAREYRDRPDFYFIARGGHYPVAQEGALKLKELSYIHAEGMPASELKHGTLALIEKGTPVVVIAPNGPGYDDTISNAQELAARGAHIIGVAQKPHPVFKHTVRIPASNGTVAPVIEVVPLQLLAYFMATERKNDPDHPRNLAKSVTVK